MNFTFEKKKKKKGFLIFLPFMNFSMPVSWYEQETQQKKWK